MKKTHEAHSMQKNKRHIQKIFVNNPFIPMPEQSLVCCCKQFSKPNQFTNCQANSAQGNKKIKIIIIYYTTLVLPWVAT